jgi:hypothetical protein
VKIEDWLKVRFEDCAPPFDFPLVRLDDIVFGLPREIQMRTKGVRAAVIKFLHEEGAEQCSRNTKGDGRSNYRLWIIRDLDLWRNAGPTARIDAYEKHHESRVDLTLPGQ